MLPGQGFKQSGTEAQQVQERLEVFIEYFVEEFENKLQAYIMFLEGKAEKVGKFSDTFSGKIGQGVVGAVGGLVGLLVASPAIGAKVGASAGDEAGKFIGNKLGNKFHKNKITNILSLVECFRNDKNNFRKVIVEAGFDIFQSFELQFMRVSLDKDPRRAIQQLAIDATNRAIDYLGKNKEANVSKAVILGNSKTITKAQLEPKPNLSYSPGFNIEYEFKSIKETWNTSSLYSKVGILVNKNGNELSFYKKKSGSNTGKYGYRRLLIVENWSELEKEYSLDNIAESKSGQFTDYNYILDQNESKQKVEIILKKINLNDKGLEETRMKEIIEEFKDEVIEEIQSLKKQCFNSEDRTKLLCLESSLKSLNIEECLEKFKEEVKQGHLQIVKSIEKGQQQNEESFNKLSKKQDIQHDHQTQEHTKTQEEIRNTIQEIGNLKIAVNELPEKLEKSKQFINKGPITFDVKDPVRSFIGRKQELDDLHSKIQRGSERVTVISQMTSITGLGGIGKTELAREYIRIYGKHYDSNVIWINAESGATLRKSFCRLAQDKLNISTKNADDKEKDTKSIVEDVYKYFAKRKVLFVFDNAENNDEFKNYLPLYALDASDNKPYILITSRENNEQWGIQEGITLDVFTEEEAISFVKEALKEAMEEEDLQEKKIKKLALDKLHRFPLVLQQAVAHIVQENKKYKRRGKGKYTIDNFIEDYEKKTAELLNSDAFRRLDNDYAKTTLTTWKVTIEKIKEDVEFGQLASNILDVISYFVANNIIVDEMFLKLNGDEERLWNAVELLNQYSMIKLREGKIDVHRLVQEVIRLELREQNREEQTLRKALDLISKLDSDHVTSVWMFASEYANLIKEFSDQFDHTHPYSFETIFHLLAENDSHEAMENILKHVNRDVESIVNAVDIYKRTPLYIAAENNYIEVVKLLASRGAKLGCTTTIVNNALSTILTTDWTPLHVAAFNGHLDVVRFLVSKDKTLLDIKDSLGQTPPVLAIHKGHLDVVKLIDPNDDVSKLHIAVRNNNLKEVKTLVENNVDILNSKLGNWIPLHLAAFIGNLEVVEYLVIKNLEENINKNDGLDHPSNDGFTPLHAASSIGHLEVVKLLIRKGANFRALDEEGCTLLHAASHNGQLSVVKYLIDDMGFDVNICDSDNDTPLHAAAYQGKLDVVQFLLDRGANINSKTNLGLTPLFYVAAGNDKTISKFLLEKGAEGIDLTDDKTLIGRLNISVLHLAAFHDDDEMIEYLIEEKGIDKDIGKDVSCTPLHVAAFFGNRAAIDKLIDKGACVDAHLHISDIALLCISNMEVFYKIDSSLLNRIRSLYPLLAFAKTQQIKKITSNDLYKLWDYPEKSFLKEKQRRGLYNMQPEFAEFIKQFFPLDTIRKKVVNWIRFKKRSKGINFVHPNANKIMYEGDLPEIGVDVMELLERVNKFISTPPEQNTSSSNDATDVDFELD